jgi:hypothetical protein
MKEHRVKHPGLCPTCLTPSLEFVRTQSGEDQIVRYLQCEVCGWTQLKPEIQQQFPFINEGTLTPSHKTVHLNPGQ